MLLMSPLSSGLNIRQRSRAIAVAIVQTRLPLANHGEGEIPTGTTIEGLVDPEHPKGLEQSRDPKRAGVDRLEPDIAHEIQDRGLPCRVVTRNEHDRRDRISGQIGHIVEAGRFERLEHRGTRRPLRAAQGSTTASPNSADALNG